MVRVQVPATTANLGPGFDCLGMALKLYNIIEMAPVSSGLLIEVQGEGIDEIACDETNIVYRAAAKVFERAGWVPKGLRIKLINNIPVARGLGSSAAAIVGGLVAANILTDNKVPQKEILALAASLEGHSDNVAPALLGGIVISVVTEGDVKYVKINPPAGIKTIVVIPDFTVLTSVSRKVLPRQVNLKDVVFNLGRLALLVGALSKGDLGVLLTAMEDRIHQPYRASLVPGMKKVLAAARLAGAKGVCLSGAGPSIIAFTDYNFELIARVMKDTFKESGVLARALIIDPNRTGAVALEIK